MQIDNVGIFSYEEYSKATLSELLQRLSFLYSSNVSNHKREIEDVKLWIEQQRWLDEQKRTRHFMCINWTLVVVTALLGIINLFK